MTQSLQRHHDISVSICIPFSSSSQSKAALNALIPDNVNFPKGLSIKMYVRGSMLSIDVHGRNIPVSTILATIDEVLEHTSVAKKVMTK